jgi:ferredoxin
MGEKKAEVDISKCILCGYCAAVCPEYVIRVV